MKTYAYKNGSGMIVGVGRIYYANGQLTPGANEFVEELGEEDGIKAFGDSVKQDSSLTTVVVATSEMPGGASNGKYEKVLRGAFKHEGGHKVDVCLDTAKQLTHNIRRGKRAQEFSPYDEIIAKQIPGVGSEEAESKRQIIRDKYTDIQGRIDAAEGPETLTEIIVEIGAA